METSIKGQLEELRSAVKAVLHQLERGEAAEGDLRDVAWCAAALRAAIEPTTVLDVPFEEARDVNSIKYRLHPLDVGFDVRRNNRRASINPKEDPIRISYAAKDGSRRVISGKQAAVLDYLRKLGYRFQFWGMK